MGGQREAALDRLGSDGDGFDAVFSDVVMPGMGGVALAEALRQPPAAPASGAHLRYSHVLAEEGSHGFELLHKPYSAEQLSTRPAPIGSGSGTRTSETHDRCAQAHRS